MKPHQLKLAAGLAIGAMIACVQSANAANDSLRDSCDSIEPAWKTTLQNGGVAEIDRDTRKEGDASICLRWEPQPAVAADGTASVEQSPDGALALCSAPKIPVIAGQPYRLKFWLRNEGDPGCGSTNDYAHLKVEVLWRTSEGSTHLQFETLAKSQPNWTEITEFATHPGSDKMFSAAVGRPLAELVAPGDATSVELRFTMALKNRIAKFWIDDVRLEPATGK